MGVQLNIKDERTVELARELASQFGESVTQTIRRALEEKAARLSASPAGDPDGADLLALVDAADVRWRPELDGVELSTRHGELLYDENGVPA